MKNKKIVNFFKATIISVIVAFLFIASVCVFYNYALKEKFETVADIVQTLAVRNKTYEPVKLELVNEELKSKPLINSEYARLKIEKINVDLPIFYGESLNVLQNGIGQHLESYFPGEGGSVLCMGHNYKKYLQRLPEVEEGDKIVVETEYGTYEYTVFNTKVVHETDVHEAPIQDQEEIFMLYTCYPTYGLGHATHRFIVYAK